MAPPMSAGGFLNRLREEGVTVVEVGDWEHHNRNHKGPWGPVHGVMIHHSVTSGSELTVGICRAGRPDLPARCATASSPRTVSCTSWATAGPTTRAWVTTTCCAP